MCSENKAFTYFAAARGQLLFALHAQTKYASGKNARIQSSFKIKNGQNLF
jgi:hypothetical protein